MPDRRVECIEYARAPSKGRLLVKIAAALRADEGAPLKPRSCVCKGSPVTRYWLLYLPYRSSIPLYLRYSAVLAVSSFPHNTGIAWASLYRGNTAKSPEPGLYRYNAVSFNTGIKILYRYWPGLILCIARCFWMVADFFWLQHAVGRQFSWMSKSATGPLVVTFGHLKSCTLHACQTNRAS